jgi:hypothetical protein
VIVVFGLQSLLAEHSVLVFRGQHAMTPEDEEAFVQGLVLSCFVLPSYVLSFFMSSHILSCYVLSSLSLSLSLFPMS